MVNVIRDPTFATDESRAEVVFERHLRRGPNQKEVDALVASFASG